ncbi:homocitrate synthase/isopropylmalate synthase family protein [Dendrosporobacter sp. 1207_IL3150]|uniref:homocitrate synthase/isopropylmalate synthase family protein n=1 Tax=Dendrosporobacter sp. 1207_IL3150 TaxID=3084054 RepID=UPI002FD9A835
MSKPLIFIDQTINQGFKQALSKGKITELVRLTKDICLDCADIDFDNWSKLPEKSGLPIKKMRGNIEPCSQQILEAAKLGMKAVTISIYFQDVLEVEQISKALKQAKELNLVVGLRIGDASALTALELVNFVECFDSELIDTLIYCDEDSLLEPLSTYDILSFLSQKLKQELEFHAYNDMGLAAGNTLAAIRAGVRRVAVEIAGTELYAALEQVMLGCKFLINEPIEISNKLADLCSQAAACFGKALPQNRPIIGNNVFAHESGIHVDGVIKNPELYEPFAPEVVGLTRKLVIGKHSGTASIKAKLRSWNMPISEFTAVLLLDLVRKKANDIRGPLSDFELINLYYEIFGLVQDNAIGGVEICREEKKYTSLIRHCGMGNRRQAWFLPQKKSLQ